MKEKVTFEEIHLENIDELAKLYVETFNAHPWNDHWTMASAGKRLHQMLHTEESYGIAIYKDEILCGAILGSFEQFYHGSMFTIKEFWVTRDGRGHGLGTKLYQEFEHRLHLKDVKEIYLFTIKGHATEHFYHKQGFATSPDMVFLNKKLSDK